MGYSSIVWLPITAVLTGIGLAATYYYGRSRGTRAMARGVAWSLIPIAAYLTGSIKMLWKIGDAIGNFASGFVFSPVKWAGIAVTGAAVVLFVSTSGRERRKAARARAAERAQKRKSAGGAATPAGVAPSGATAATSVMPAARTPEPAKTVPAKTAPAKRSGAPVDDDLKDIEEILRNRGILCQSGRLCGI